MSFTISVTNGGSNALAVFAGKTVSGATAENLTAVAGTANPSNTLSVVPSSSGWTAQPHNQTTKTYYTSTASGSTFSTTFSFMVPPGTPPDTYQMWMRASGLDSNKWTQATSVLVTVGAVPEPATFAMLSGGALVGLICWRGRKRRAQK